MEMFKVRNNLQEEKNAKRTSLFFYAKLVLIIFTVILACNFVGARFFSVVVSGDSMQPSLNSGDFLVVDTRTNISRGDIIIVDKTPNYLKNTDKTVWLIKRVVGLPGETVILKDGYVYIKSTPNSEPYKLDEPYVIKQGVTEPARENDAWTEFTVPDGEYLFLGDNRIGANSKDSRYRDYLTCDKEEIMGVVAEWSLKLRWLNNVVFNLFD